jgi:hypothetical protein
VFGDNMPGFAAFNAAALGLLPLFAFGFAAALRGPAPGLFCATLVAISPACVNQSILAETPAAFFVALGLLTMAVFQRAGLVWLAMLGAAFLGVAWLCRPDSFVYVVAALALTVRLGRGWNRFTGSIGFALVAFSFVVAVSLYNRPLYGQSLPVRYDAYLRYILVFDTDRNYQINPDATAVQEIRASLRQSGAAAERDLDGIAFLGWNRGWWVVRQSLSATAGSYCEADRVMSEAPNGVIRANVGSFFENAARTLASFVVFRPVLGAYTFAHFESKPDYDWRRFDLTKIDNPDETEQITAHLYDSLRKARLDLPYNNWNNPYSTRYLRFLSLAPLVIYAAVLWLIGTATGPFRMQALALFTSPLLAFAAYAISGFFDYRYLFTHSWALWTLAGLGLAAVVEWSLSRVWRKSQVGLPGKTHEPSTA